VLQQILIIPSLPFTIGHAILASTTTKAPQGDPEVSEYIANIFRPLQLSGTRLIDVQKADLARQIGELNYDKEWLMDPINRAKLGRLLPTVIAGRPARTVAQQARALIAMDVRESLPKIPSQIRVLVIHGKLDRVIHYVESEHIMRGITHARRVTVDPSRMIPGSIPSDQFGHFWFHYFDIDLWLGVIETFLDDLSMGNARL